MKMRIISDQRGFTMLEMMVVVGISTMIAYAMFLAMRTGDRQLEVAELKMNIQDSAREGLYKMVQEVRMSAPNRITMGAGCTTLTFNIPDPNNPVNPLTYEVNWPGHQISYALTNGQIIRNNVTLGSSTVLANDVTAISFTTDTTSPFTCSTTAAPELITVVMSVQRALKNGRLVPATALQLAGQARIRNPT